MAQSRQLFLFGDQTADFVPKLRSLLSVQDCPILAAFLDQSHYVVRAQMLQSMNTVDHKLARTADLRQMVQKYVDGKLTPAFRTALVCLCQLGCFIRYVLPFCPTSDRFHHFLLKILLGNMRNLATGTRSPVTATCWGSAWVPWPLWR